MPNTTVPYMYSLTPEKVGDCLIEKWMIDEYVQTDLEYLKLLDGTMPTLLALVGVQSHQFQRAIDLAAYASKNGILSIIGGPHPMTCDTSMLQNRGISFALAEAELIWMSIIQDAIGGELQAVYGKEQRWQPQLKAPVMIPPSRRDMKRYVIPLLGVYPARGCPYTCNFCSVIKIAGRTVRSQSVDITMETLWEAKKTGVSFIFFTSDNFNKWNDAKELMERMIEEKLNLPFMVQCDTQVSKQEDFIELLGRAGCFQMFVGVESLNRETLLKVHKTQNHPVKYAEIIRLAKKHGLDSHFSNIIGFPDDTEKSIREHVRQVKDMGPGAASFYILTPLPGTEQYDEFLSNGWIYEKNLDRFDATCPTWEHPSLSPNQLIELMFESYREFYSDEFLFRSLTTKHQGMGWKSDLIARVFPFFNRYSVWKRKHPMSGGIGEVKRDHVSDYIHLRWKTYGYDLIPLPKSLVLSEADQRINREAKLPADTLVTA